VALNNGEVAADLRDVLAAAAWPHLALLNDAEVVIAPALPGVPGPDARSTKSSTLRVAGRDAMVLRLTAWSRSAESETP